MGSKKNKFKRFLEKAAKTVASWPKERQTTLDMINDSILNPKIKKKPRRESK